MDIMKSPSQHQSCDTTQMIKKKREREKGFTFYCPLKTNLRGHWEWEGLVRDTSVRDISVTINSKALSGRYQCDHIIFQPLR